MFQLTECGFGSAMLKSSMWALSLNVHIQNAQLSQPKIVQELTVNISCIAARQGSPPFSTPICFSKMHSENKFKKYFQGWHKSFGEQAVCGHWFLRPQNDG